MPTSGEDGSGTSGWVICSGAWFGSGDVMGLHELMVSDGAPPGAAPPVQIAADLALRPSDQYSARGEAPGARSGRPAGRVLAATGPGDQGAGAEPARCRSGRFVRTKGMASQRQIGRREGVSPDPSSEWFVRSSARQLACRCHEHFTRLHSLGHRRHFGPRCGQRLPVRTPTAAQVVLPAVPSSRVRGAPGSREPRHRQQGRGPLDSGTRRRPQRVRTPLERVTGCLSWDSPVVDRADQSRTVEERSHPQIGRGARRALDRHQSSRPPLLALGAPHSAP